MHTPKPKTIVSNYKLGTSLFLLLFLSVLASHSAVAQCNVELAQKRYDIRQFELVLDTLEQCMEQENFKNVSEEIDVLRLLACTHIALDSLGRANYYIKEILLLNRYFQPNSRDPLVFRKMVELLKIRGLEYEISSVSKKPENVYTAPATVMILTSKEIEQRGYIDLEQLFEDLPGFDVSRTMATTYSNIYQRGYRSDQTDRTIFMINGIEENDFWGNFVQWARQFPISNVQRIEIVYGPSSTMYGANAFLGVVNIITRDPIDLVGIGKSVGVRADVGAGSFNTQYLDLTVSGRAGNMHFSVTGRHLRSDEHDLSKYPEYDYNLDDYDKIDYGEELSNDDSLEIAEFIQGNGDTSVFRIIRNNNNEPIRLEPTQAAMDSAKKFDKDLYAQPLNGEPLGYGNFLEMYYLHGKIRTSELTLGYQYWTTRQGNTNFGNDNSRPGGKDLTYWQPAQTLLYAQYEKELVNQRLTMINTAQFRTTQATDSSRVVNLKNYSNGTLSPLDLSNNKQPFWEIRYFFQRSKQFRNETKFLYYRPSGKLDAIGGIEYRFSTIQGDYQSSTIGAPQETASSSLDTLPGGNSFDQLNLGAYIQGTYTFNEHIKVTLGGRYDYNRIRVSGGYGSVFNPRVAVVWMPGKWIVKGIYATAFQDASSRDRYSIAPPTRLRNNPNLGVEKVESIEGVLAYRGKGNDDIYFELSIYYNTYSDFIAQWGDQLQNAGALNIFGIQSQFRWRLNETYDLYANITHHNGEIENLKPADSTDTRRFLPIGDIADFRFNVGVNAQFFEKKLNVNLRANYVGTRRVGPDTSVRENPQEGGKFDPYFLLNGAITFKPFSNIGLRIQYIQNNILDTEYFHPGVRAANGNTLAYRTPQRPRHSTFRLLYEF